MTASLIAIPRQVLVTVVDAQRQYLTGDAKQVWAIHDLRLKIARAFDPRTGTATIYLKPKDVALLQGTEGGSEVRSMWQPRGQVARGNVTFTLAPRFAQHILAHTRRA